ncbi:MAG: hypothetical protein P1U58_15545 [Verrucomicrobiales bacterium]|nr:hypothetical protein [Verrucomicrobiales bacterium]
MTERSNAFYWKEIMGTILWIAAVYFFFGEDFRELYREWLKRS